MTTIKIKISQSTVDFLRAALALDERGHVLCGGEDCGHVAAVVMRCTDDELSVAVRVALLGGDWIPRKIEDGAIWNFNASSGKRAKNWVAVVRSDRMAPGGLDRRFLRRGSGEWVAADVRVGDVIEFAGDNYTSRGQKLASREYEKVMAILPGVLVTEDCTPGGKLKPCREVEVEA